MLVHNLGSLSVKFETVPVPGWQKETEGGADPSRLVVTSLKAREHTCEAGLEWL